MNTMISLRERGSDVDTSWMDVDVSTRGVWLRPASWVSENSGIEYKVFAWAGTEAGLEIPPAADASRGWAGPAVFMAIAQVYDYLIENDHAGSAGNMVADIIWAARKAEKSAPWESAKKAELVNLTEATQGCSMPPLSAVGISGLQAGEDVNNPGAALQSLRKRVEHICPVCGERFEGYEYARVCRKPACKSKHKRLKAKANKKPAD